MRFCRKSTSLYFRCFTMSVWIIDWLLTHVVSTELILENKFDLDLLFVFGAICLYRVGIESEIFQADEASIMATDVRVSWVARPSAAMTLNEYNVELLSWIPTTCDIFGEEKWYALGIWSLFSQNNSSQQGFMYVLRRILTKPLSSFNWLAERIITSQPFTWM